MPTLLTCLLLVAYLSCVHKIDAETVKTRIEKVTQILGTENIWVK